VAPHAQDRQDVAAFATWLAREAATQKHADGAQDDAAAAPGKRARRAAARP
jgi:hypothetical protein